MLERRGFKYLLHFLSFDLKQRIKDYCCHSKPSGKAFCGSAVLFQWPWNSGSMRTLLCHYIYMPCLSCSLLLNTVLSMLVQNAFAGLLRSLFSLTALKATKVKCFPFIVLPFSIFYFNCVHASIKFLSLLVKANEVIKMFCNSCNKVQHNTYIYILQQVFQKHVLFLILPWNQEKTVLPVTH